MKDLILFISRELHLDRASFLRYAVISGLANAAILAIINVAAANAAEEVKSHRFLVLFVIGVAVYSLSQKRVMTVASEEAEQIIHRIRLRMIRTLHDAELEELEDVGRAEIYSSFRSDTSTISESAVHLATALQSALLIVFVLVYIAFLSLTAFVLNVLCTAVGAGIYLMRAAEVNQRIHEAMREENALQNGLKDMLDGFKEVKLSSDRGEELCDWIRQASHRATVSKIHRQRLHAISFVSSQITFFTLMGAMVFLVPMIGHAYSDVVIKATAATIFLMGPIANVVTVIPVVETVRASIQDIEALRERLERARRPQPERKLPIGDFSEIRLDGVSFSYAMNGERFVIGPLDVTFRRGETVFITGGNGSGKTTLLRLLTGLYAPDSGRLAVDGTPVDEARIDSYRGLFAAVFSDNHLFKRLYGIPSPSRAEIDELFALLEMTGTTEIADREFESIDVSSGQKKRLALMSAALEHRPILVLDEWAADQDPHFRKTFYAEILEWLKRRGVTIIAVTHDDRYYRHADRVLEMLEGRIVADRSSEEHGADLA